MLYGSSPTSSSSKLEVIVLGTVNQLWQATSVDSVQIAVESLSVASTLKSLGIVLDQRPTFDDHATTVAKCCNYHTRAFGHVCHLLPESVAQTWSAVWSTADSYYCNSLLYWATESTLDKLYRAQTNAARVDLSADSRSICAYQCASTSSIQRNTDRRSCTSEQSPEPARCRQPYTFWCPTNTVSTKSDKRLYQKLIQLFCPNNLEQTTRRYFTQSQQILLQIILWRNRNGY